jgi:hypothetical protein
MASQRAAGQRFRQRKLSTKQNLAILRENEVEAIFDDEAQRNIPRVETGVEKAEEVVSSYPDTSFALKFRISFARKIHVIPLAYVPIGKSRYFYR